MSPADRRARVDRDDPVLAIVAQCRLLKIARSTLFTGRPRLTRMIWR